MLRWKKDSLKNRPPKIEDVADQVTETQMAVAEVYEGQAVTDAQVTETQVALAEMYEQVSEQLSEVQLALAEIYEGGMA